MYEYQEKQISKIAKATAEILSQYVRPEEAPEADPAKIETCMIDAVDKTEAIRRFLNIVLNISHVWPCGYYAHEAELIEIVKDELAERRRDAIRDSFRDTWDDDPDPEIVDGERQQDMYRYER